ncbi:MAG: tetratricopeptide repeat protein, partial [Ginsengibacter sp.]
MFSIFKFPNSYFPVLLICIVTILLAAGCNQNSKKNDDKNIEKTSSDPKELALLYLAENHLDEAVAAFQQAIKMNPEDSSTYIGLTRLYLLQKNYDAAEDLCKEGLKIKPGNIDLKLLLAEVYGLKNDKENATKQLKEIIEQDPKNVNAYYLLDSISSNQNSRKYYLLKILSLAPANIVPRLQLAELFAVESNIDSSLFYLQSVKKIAPGFSDAAEISYQKATSILSGNKPALALPYIRQFHSLMKITSEYATGSDEIKIPKMIAGYFTMDTNIPVSSFGTTQSSTPGEDNSFRG